MMNNSSRCVCFTHQHFHEGVDPLLRHFNRDFSCIPHCVFGIKNLFPCGGIRKSNSWKSSFKSAARNKKKGTKIIYLQQNESTNQNNIVICNNKVNQTMVSPLTKEKKRKEVRRGREVRVSFLRLLPPRRDSGKAAEEASK